MATHILAITYQPKIAGVRDGTIRQTIRPYNPQNPRQVADKLILHGWAGKPYRSPWNWRQQEQVWQAIDMVALRDVVGFWQNPITGIPFSNQSVLINYCSWFDFAVDEIAKLDGISPPTGEELKHVLESYHGKFTDKPIQFQVIRW